MKGQSKTAHTPEEYVAELTEPRKSDIPNTTATSPRSSAVFRARGDPAIAETSQALSANNRHTSAIHQRGSEEDWCCVSGRTDSEEASARRTARRQAAS